ncbi:MAG: hypothetical protein LC689_14140 [Myxococcales bacterium]|nr:hypothetical protein [Myxococcales bacterium]
MSGLLGSSAKAPTDWEPMPLVIEVQCGPPVSVTADWASNVFHTPPPAVAT